MREFLCLGIGLTLLSGATGGNAAPPEPLLIPPQPDSGPNYVPPPSDGDPNYVPPPLGPKGAKRRTDETDESPTVEQAMEDFGRALGQAAVVIRQKAQARCRDKIPTDLPAEQRYAWEANCSYQRY